MIVSSVPERLQTTPPGSCPFLAKAGRTNGRIYPHGVICRAGPGQAPSADEFAWFCTDNHYRACTTYRSHGQADEP